MDEDKQKIIDLFNKNVRGKKANTDRANPNHDGKGGHWLETQMGIKHNGDNAPDLFGFEMKNNTTSKTTFGDWSPSRISRIFRRGNEYNLSRSDFLRIFGSPNPLKENRNSWSGRPAPKIERFNDFGQKLVVDTDNNISAIYSYSQDKRENKHLIVPDALQQEDLILAIWSAELMKVRVENKFNKKGWFKCQKDEDGKYSQIVFGKPINFDSWIEGVRKGLIFFDSGMFDGNLRPYANWRANNAYWDSLITERY